MVCSASPLEYSSASVMCRLLRGGVHFDGPTIHLERVGQGQVIVFDVADLRLARRVVDRCRW